MPVIYFKNLNNKAVCRALFEAAEKTEAGKAEKNLGKQSFDSIPGVWEPLHDYEIEEALWASRHSGFLLDIGYLQVKLQFEINSVDVTYYEKTYGVSALKILVAAGFTCSDQPISASSLYDVSPAVYSPLRFYASNNMPENKGPVDNKIVPYSKNIESDKRFKRSAKKGIIFEADSYGFISDEDLIALGAKTWTRDKINIIDNIVLISEMAQKEELLQQSPKLTGMR